MNKIEKIKALSGRATEGPWSNSYSQLMGENIGIAVFKNRNIGWNADLIICLRDSIDSIIEAHEVMQKALEEVAGQRTLSGWATKKPLSTMLSEIAQQALTKVEELMSEDVKEEEV